MKIVTTSIKCNVTEKYMSMTISGYSSVLLFYSVTVHCITIAIAFSIALVHRSLLSTVPISLVYGPFNCNITEFP